MEKSYNLTNILFPYAQEKLWVVLSEDRKKVVASGKTPKEALEKAKEKKVEKPILLQAIPDYSGFVPLA